jgi:dihydrofolate reductase
VTDEMQDRSKEVELTEGIFDMSVSLDGFVRAPNATPEQPLGDGGERLHEWAFGGDERDREVLAPRGARGSGAIIAGRRTYDDSVPFWGADGPHPPTRVSVVTHEASDAVPEGGVYTFVTDGIESALEQAKSAAGDKNVNVMGGPDMGRQFIEAGLLDEIGVHLVPVLFGSGTRMFEHLGSKHIQLETIGAIETSAATHLRYRIVKRRRIRGGRARRRDPLEKGGWWISRGEEMHPTEGEIWKNAAGE